MSKFRDIAEKRWQNSDVTGDGPYASVSRCGSVVSVYLYPSREEAEKAKKFIDQMGCGGKCKKKHEVIDLQT